MDKELSITLVCLFCSKPLEAEEGVEFESDDLIECNACGESNLHESLVAVAIEKAESIITSQMTADLKKTFRKILK